MEGAQGMFVTSAPSPFPFYHPPTHSATYLLTPAADHPTICLFSIWR